MHSLGGWVPISSLLKGKASFLALSSVGGFICVLVQNVLYTYNPFSPALAQAFFIPTGLTAAVLLSDQSSALYWVTY